jgi:hypothetical protein
MDPKILGKIISRRHPEYDKLVKHWSFLELCYDGGRDWFKENIFRYLKEGDTEFEDRKKRAYRFNHTKEIVDLVGKYIFKAKIHRNDKIAPAEIKTFWRKTNRSGSLNINNFMKVIDKKSSTFGRIWVVVDNTRAIEGVEQREYAYIVSPTDALDFSYDDDGHLNWILFRESYRDDDDVLSSSGDVCARYRLWTKEEWFLIKETSKKSDKNKTGELIASGYHGLGVVPAFKVDHNEDEDLYSSPSLVGDIAYLDRACANYLSNLDAIIQDQTFSQLAMPAQGMLPGDDNYDKIIAAGTKRIFTYDNEGGTAPFYLSPDVKQAEVIVTVIGKIINEIYHTVGMAGERTKQDNSIGIDNSSGVAKSIDFERVNALLTTKATSLARAEYNLLKLVKLWSGIEIEDEELESLVAYPDTFDVRGIADEFTIASNLILIEAPISMRKEQLKIITPKIFPRLDKKTEAEILKEIDEMEDMSDLFEQTMSQDKPDPVGGIKKNNQGEANTGDDIASKSNF